MKKLIKITTLAMLIVMLFSITACSQSGKIESVNDHYSVYRYKVKEVQLIDKNASDGGIEVLATSKDFKYYYSNNEYEVYATDSIYGNSDLQYYFPDFHIVSSYDKSQISESGNYCKEYDTNVSIRVILDKVDKIYRPTYKVNGTVATITYYKSEGFASGSIAFKKEINFSEAEKILKEAAQKAFDLRNDESALEEYEKQLEEKYQGCICVCQITETFDLINTSLEVTYHV